MEQFLSFPANIFLDLGFFSFLIFQNQSAVGNVIQLNKKIRLTPVF